MMDKIDITLITVICISVLVAAVQIGRIVAAYSISKDCETINAFRINDDVYSCMREYHYYDYT
jgi:type III secretory pathway component EscU